MPTQTLDPFNDGRPLRVARLEDGRFCVLDDALRRAWVEHALESQLLRDSEMQFVTVPAIPEHYGSWVVKPIGGVSMTVRRRGILRSHAKFADPVVLFAVRAPHADAVSDALRECAGVSVGAAQSDDEFGWVAEVVVHDAEQVDVVGARIAGAGATPVFERPDANACRDLAIERLDRIGAAVVTSDDMVEAKDDLHGMRRGCDNWRFAWLPEHWEPPITWDHMVRNVQDAPLRALPKILAQHVAQHRLDCEKYERIGSRWMPTSPLLASELDWAEAHPGERPPFPLRRVLSVGDGVRDEIECGFDVDLDIFSEEAHRVDGVPLVAVVGHDGLTYAPVDTRAELRRHIPRAGRYVSPHLSAAQSKQLIECFYALSVLRTSDADVVHAAKLILFRYMLERGYTARWLGKYEQDAQHVGNGETFRRFSSRLQQYVTHKLPAEVLNRLCASDGTLRNRGSKGSRSKYKKDGVTPYIPNRRMARSREAERAMRS